MFGTISLIALLTVGLLHVSMWFVVPFAVLNAVIGLFTPRDRIAHLKKTGSTPIKFIVGALPLHLVLAIFVYGVGFGIGLLFDG